MNSIFLFAIAKAGYLKAFGCDAIITKFTNQLNQLSKVKQTH